MKRLEALLEWGGTKRDIAFLILSGAALLLSILKLFPELPFDIAWVSIILCGLPIIAEAFIGLVTAFDIKADVLVSMALIASVCIHEDFAAGEVAFIMQLGALLEELTVARARAGIEKLVGLTPTTARRIVKGSEEVIAAEQVRPDDILRVLPGETVPVDGIIISGQTSVNQAVMTGESLPVDKSVGDEVASGTVNLFGAFEMKAVRVGEDSSIQRMIRLVRSADAGKAKIVGVADRWATWVVVIALTAALLTWLVTGRIIRAVTILVVFCPCSLVLATPTAIMAAIGNATKHGFLIREGDALERLSAVKRVTFDKTGTLTEGIPKVTCVRVLTDEYTADELYSLTACVEKNSEHPLGKAVVSCFQEQYDRKPDAVTEFQMIPGRGVVGRAKDLRVAAGNEKLLCDEGIEVSDEAKSLADQELAEGATVIYVAVDGKLAGYIALSDSIRKESGNMLRKLQSMGIVPVLLTGDHGAAADHIASELGIAEVHAECLPEDKLRLIGQYQQNGEPVCMIGDGVNDAPALKKAHVGIAMGGVGSDIAVDAADIALVDDEVKEFPHLMALSCKMMRKIRFNLAFSMLLNFAAIVLAMTGILNPVVGALVHNCGSVFVILNSAFLLRYKKQGF